MLSIFFMVIGQVVHTTTITAVLSLHGNAREFLNEW